MSSYAILIDAVHSSNDLLWEPEFDRNLYWTVHTPAGRVASKQVLSAIDADGLIINRRLAYGVRSVNHRRCASSMVLHDFYGMTFDLSLDSPTRAKSDHRLGLRFAYPIDSGPDEEIRGGDFIAEELPEDGLRMTVTNGVHCIRENEIGAEEVCLAQEQPLVLEFSGTLFADRRQDFQITQSRTFTDPNGDPMCTARAEP